MTNLNICVEEDVSEAPPSTDNQPGKTRHRTPPPPLAPVNSIRRRPFVKAHPHSIRSAPVVACFKLARASKESTNHVDDVAESGWSQVSFGYQRLGSRPCTLTSLVFYYVYVVGCGWLAHMTCMQHATRKIARAAAYDFP